MRTRTEEEKAAPSPLGHPAPQGAPVIPLKPAPSQSQPLQAAVPGRPETSFRPPPAPSARPSAPPPQQPARPLPPEAQQQQPPTTIAEAAQARPGRSMTLKKVEVEIPPEIATPPPVASKAASPAAQADVARRIVASLIAFAGVAVLDAGPIAAEMHKDSAMATQQAVMTAAIALIIGLLLVLRKPLATVSGCVIISYHVIYSFLVAFAPTLILGVLPSRSMWLTTTELAAGAAVLFIGSVILATGRGAVVWGFSIVTAIGGAVIPLLPVSDFFEKDLGITITRTMAPAAAKDTRAAGTAPAAAASVTTPAAAPAVVGTAGTTPAAMATTTFNTPSFSAILPQDWQQRSTPTSSRNADLCMVGPADIPGLTVLITRSTAPGSDPAELAKQHMMALASVTPGANGIVNGVPGFRDRARIYLPAGASVQDVLIVVKGSVMFLLSCQAPRELWVAHRSELDLVYMNFQPR